MAWSNPATFVAGTALTAAQMNVIGGDLTYLNGTPSCDVGVSTGTSLTTSTWTRLNWDTNNYDNASIHSISTNTWKFLLADAGAYDVSIQIGYAANSTGVRSCNVDLNNSSSTVSSGTRSWSGRAAAGNSQIMTAQANFKFKAAAGDFLSVFAFQNTGGALSTDAPSSWVDIARLGTG